MNSVQSGACNTTDSVAADRRAIAALLLAAVIGIGLGSLTAAGWIGGDSLPGTVVARVNDTDIRLGEYNRALSLFASEKRDPIKNQDRMLVLERMVEEELLIQHGLHSGLIRSDQSVRAAIVQSMLAGMLVETEAGAGKVSDDTQLREYLGQLREASNVRWMTGGAGP